MAEIVKNGAGATLLVGDVGASDPAGGVAAVTPSDSTVLTGVRGLWVGTAGDVAIVARDGTTAVLANVADGTLVPVEATKVKSTGTTASDIVALL